MRPSSLRIGMFSPCSSARWWIGAALALAATATCAAEPATAPPACKPGATWTDPAPPQRLHGTIWFAGSCGLTSLLVRTDDGDILLDGGIANTAPQILTNLRRLGVDPRGIRYLLNSHGHFDHVGGFAELQRATGAIVVARGADADAIERGRGDRSDPQYLSTDAFDPVPKVRRVADGETIALGGTVLTAHATPGHTPGSISWSWDSCERERCVHVVYADSLTAFTDEKYRYSDHPDFLAQLRASIASVAALPCDLLVTPHPDASALWERIGPDAKSPLIDTGACRRYADRSTGFLEKRLAKEAEPRTVAGTAKPKS